jgi:hypothetical protein
MVCLRMRARGINSGNCRETATGTTGCARTVPLWLAGLLAVLLLVAAGIVYRVDASRVERQLPISLPVPLNSIPLQLDGWTGRHLEIPTTTRQYMETNYAEGMWADLYVVYCSSRLGGLIGHNPRVCYPGNGWIWDKTSPSEFVTTSGRHIPCLQHQFHRPAPDYRQVTVLSFYVLNGTITLDQRDFSDLWGRRINLFGDPARYVAQVQVSSVSERSARAAISSLAETILTFLPDQYGHASAADHADRYITEERPNQMP